MPDLPVYLISGCPNPFGSGTAPFFYTGGPGKALFTGQCSDPNRVNGLTPRGLADLATPWCNWLSLQYDPGHSCHGSPWKPAFCIARYVEVFVLDSEQPTASPLPKKSTG
jgi:hypothetical protein